MRRIVFTIIGVLVVMTGYAFSVYPRVSTKNPDPNHTHADFAVWVDGQQLDFSRPEFMSGTSEEDDPAHRDKHPYLHLHDGNGHVIHRHKPGLTLMDFFHSIGVTTRIKSGGQMCIMFPHIGNEDCESPEHRYLLFVNDFGQKKFLSDDHVFSDGDRLLITNSLDPTEQQKQLSLMTSDACKYSQTCPWRGKPPVENCIADPTVPCVQ